MGLALAVILTILLAPVASLGQSINLCQAGRLVGGAGWRTHGLQSTGGHTLAIYYVVPADIPNDGAVLERIKQAAGDIQAWYQCASGGMTWEFAEQETVNVYHAQHERKYYLDNGNWWGSLPAEMGSLRRRSHFCRGTAGPGVNIRTVYLTGKLTVLSPERGCGYRAAAISSGWGWRIWSRSAPGYGSAAPEVFKPLLLRLLGGLSLDVVQQRWADRAH